MQGKLTKVSPGWLSTSQLVASMITFQAFKVFHSQDMNPLANRAKPYTNVLLSFEEEFWMFFVQNKQICIFWNAVLYLTY